MSLANQTLLNSLLETGEMSRASLEPGGANYEWGQNLLNACKAIAKAVPRAARVISGPHPFDQYTGPYVKMSIKFPSSDRFFSGNMWVDSLAPGWDVLVWDGEAPEGPISHFVAPDSSKWDPAWEKLPVAGSTVQWQRMLKGEEPLSRIDNDGELVNEAFNNMPGGPVDLPGLGPQDTPDQESPGRNLVLKLLQMGVRENGEWIAFEPLYYPSEDEILIPKPNKVFSAILCIHSGRRWLLKDVNYYKGDAIRKGVRYYRLDPRRVFDVDSQEEHTLRELKSLVEQGKWWGLVPEGDARDPFNYLSSKFFRTNIQKKTDWNRSTSAALKRSLASPVKGEFSRRFLGPRKKRFSELFNASKLVDAIFRGDQGAARHLSYLDSSVQNNIQGLIRRLREAPKTALEKKELLILLDEELDRLERRIKGVKDED